jgi:hypothetical protein
MSSDVPITFVPSPDFRAGRLDADGWRRPIGWVVNPATGAEYDVYTEAERERLTAELRAMLAAGHRELSTYRLQRTRVAASG